MAASKLMHRFRADESGATIIEFSVVSVVFFLIMFAIIEYGLIMMTKIAIESVAQEISRSNQVNNDPACAGDRKCLVEKLLKEKTLGLVNPEYVQVTSTVIDKPTTDSPPIPDLCLDKVGDPNPKNCTTFIDNNGIPGYQDNDAVDSYGTSGDKVEIRITYTWRVMFPMLDLLFKDGKVTMSSTTVVKNEPKSN